MLQNFTVYIHGVLTEKSFWHGRKPQTSDEKRNLVCVEEKVNFEVKFRTAFTIKLFLVWTDFYEIIF